MSDGATSYLVPGDERLGQLTRYSIGFLIERRDQAGRPVFEPCGSGVLVMIGGIRGIVTAAHVIRELENGAGSAALLTVTNKKAKASNLLFQMRDCQSLKIGLENSEHGPDLGFLRLPHLIEEPMIPENVFYNFDKRLEDLDGCIPEATLDHEVIVGMIGERTTLKQIDDVKRVDTHILTHAYCEASNFRKGVGQELDMFDVRLSHNDEVPRPEKSYGGLSGAAIWKVGEVAEARNRFVMGIAFYETGMGDDHRVVCHGPSCIYRELVNAVSKQFADFRWPKAI